MASSNFALIMSTRNYSSTLWKNT